MLLVGTKRGGLHNRHNKPHHNSWPWLDSAQVLQEGFELLQGADSEHIPRDRDLGSK